MILADFFDTDLLSFVRTILRSQTTMEAATFLHLRFFRYYLSFPTCQQRPEYRDPEASDLPSLLRSRDASVYTSATRPLGAFHHRVEGRLDSWFFSVHRMTRARSLSRIESLSPALMVSVESDRVVGVVAVLLMLLAIYYHLISESLPPICAGLE